MKTLLIQLAQSTAFYIVVYILLLIVAGVIGYITAWYYAKSVYTPVIKELEKEKEELNTQMAGLKMDVGDLKRKVENLNEKTVTLEKELAVRRKRSKSLRRLQRRVNLLKDNNSSQVLPFQKVGICFIDLIKLINI